MRPGEAPSNADLLLPFLAPYGLYVGIGALGLSSELAYGLRILFCGAAVCWAWSRYVPLTGPRGAASSIAVGVVAGLLGLGLWLALKAPLGDPTAVEAPSALAFWLQLGASVLLVPVIEEQLLRGYVLRLLLQWQSERADAPTGALRRALDQRSLFSVPPGGWSALAVVGSSVAFALGHRVVEWPAALAYGLLMAALWIVRGDLLSCVVAHAVTNLALALVAAGSGRWELW